MNLFLEQFSSRIDLFWKSQSEEVKQNILKEILIYANSNPQQFHDEIKELRFTSDQLILSVVKEALSKDAMNWGIFFEETLESILSNADTAHQPEKYLTHLMEYSYLVQVEQPFVNTIVQRMASSLDSPKVAIKIAVIATLSEFLKNQVVEKKHQITEKLQSMLKDKNWKVRCIAFKYLSFESLLPVGFKMTFADLLRKMLFGEPYPYQ